MNLFHFNFLKRFRLRPVHTFFWSFLGGCLLNQGAALAELKVCNQTESLIGVAIGYKLGEEWMTEGWWRIPADVCTSIIEGDLTTRFFYLHAEDADNGSKWRGSVFMCTSSKEFKIQGVTDCFARGYERTGFFEVDTAEQKSWQVRLTEANQTKKEDPSK